MQQTDVTQNGCVQPSLIESKFRVNPALEEVHFSEISLNDRKVIRRTPALKGLFFFA